MRSNNNNNNNSHSSSSNNQSYPGNSGGSSTGGVNFLYLAESNLTLNLSHITAILWDNPPPPPPPETSPAPSAWEQPAGLAYTTTVSTISGDFYITDRDSRLLSQSLNRLNRQHLHEHEAVLALPALYSLCDALFWLAGVSGFSQSQPPSQPAFSSEARPESGTAPATRPAQPAPPQPAKAAKLDPTAVSPGISTSTRANAASLVK